MRFASLGQNRMKGSAILQGLWHAGSDDTDDSEVGKAKCWISICMLITLALKDLQIAGRERMTAV